MSAQPCGCDPEERYVCREHTDTCREHVELTLARELETTQSRERERTFKDETKTAAAREKIDVRSIRKSVEETQRLLDCLTAEIGTLSRRCAYADAVYCAEVNQWSASDRTLHRVREVLTTFYTAPLSVSALQPLLDLAVELNPSLKDQK